MQTTKINLADKLALTCSRKGTCCHGNLVMLNPWELVQLASNKGVGVKEFRDQYSDYGGARLRFDGKAGWQQKKACSQYIENFGCSVHNGRPLACRLFPLGREIHNGVIDYMYQGNTFPCLDGCPEVTSLPLMSVAEYLAEQKTELFEKAQQEYLQLMQHLADIAFSLLLDTTLAESGDTETLKAWKEMGNEQPEFLQKRIGQEWLDALTLPDIEGDISEPISFVNRHTELLMTKAQERFEVLQTNEEWRKASILIMGVTLQLARSLGADSKQLAEHWVSTAKSYGALE